jgi:hypothetical protein
MTLALANTDDMETSTIRFWILISFPPPETRGDLLVPQHGRCQTWPTRFLPAHVPGNRAHAGPNPFLRALKHVKTSDKDFLPGRVGLRHRECISVFSTCNPSLIRPERNVQKVRCAPAPRSSEFYLGFRHELCQGHK